MPQLADDSANVYFEECLQLLAQYEWIYNFQLTRFFTDEAWMNIPIEWRQALTELSNTELNQLPYGYIKDTWPNSLKSFLASSERLSVRRTSGNHGNITPLMIRSELTRGMNPKKRHEISNSAAVIHDICQKHDCTAVVDIGSGLGYLGVVLNHQLRYKVLGIECDESRCHGADLRASKLTQDMSHYQSVPLWLKGDDCSKEQLKLVIDKHLINSSGNHGNRQPGQLDTEGDIKLGNVADCQSPGHCQCSNHGNNQTGQCGNHGNSQTGQCGNHDSLLEDSHTSIQERRPAIGREHVSDCTSHDRTMVTLVTEPECVSTKKRLCGSDLDATSSYTEQNASIKSVSSDTVTGVCLVGLHACGDLTPTMLRLYSSIDSLRAALVFSCCYHRMTQNACSEEKSFTHFPMSKCLEAAMKDLVKVKPHWALNTFAFRLAAQETRSRWDSQTTEDHYYHQKNVAFRGIFDAVLQKENLSMIKDKRKLAPRKDYTDFGTYVESVLSRVSIKGADIEALKTKMYHFYAKYEEHFCFIEPFTALQVALQGVLESVILVDRVVFLQECGLSAELLPVTDDKISPRNMAIVSWKS